MLYRTSSPERRRGAVIVLILLSLTLMLSMVALTWDGGQALAERRNAQAAADAAVMTAAADLFTNWQSNGGGFDASGTATTHAQAVAALQGYSTSNITVNLNKSRSDVTNQNVKYLGGPNQGQALGEGYVEVIISYDQPATFSAIFGSGSVNVTARAVAAAQWVYVPPIIVLNQTAAAALFLGTGSGTVYVPNNPVYVNSSASGSGSSAAMYADTTTSSGTMQAPQYNVVGTASSGFNYIAPNPPNPNFPSTGYLRTETRPVPDPLSLIPAINPATLPTQNLSAMYNSSTNTYNLQPGSYPGGIFIGSGPPLFLPATANVTMAQGVYYMNGGGFTYSGSGNITAPDGSSQASVMIYNGGSSPGSVIIQTTGTVNLAPLPPSFGLEQGITIFQDRSISNLGVTLTHTPGGTTAWNIIGCIYAANDTVTVSRSNDTSMGSQFICNALNLYGTGNMYITGNYVLSRGLTRVE